MANFTPKLAVQPFFPSFPLYISYLFDTGSKIHYGQTTVYSQDKVTEWQQLPELLEFLKWHAITTFGPALGFNKVSHLQILYMKEFDCITEKPDELIL